ncbi:MAG: nuclear transport factor 2 family protein [Cyanobacteria bacterium J06592_8]
MKSLQTVIVPQYFDVPLFDRKVQKSAEETTEETKKVWQHHIQAWDAVDLDAIMADYSEDSILILNNTVKKGIEPVRNVFANLFDLFSKGQNIIDPEVIEEEVIYITWHFTPEAEGGTCYFGTDSFVVQNSIIKYQTIGSSLYEKYIVT